MQHACSDLLHSACCGLVRMLALHCVVGWRVRRPHGLLHALPLQAATKEGDTPLQAAGENGPGLQRAQQHGLPE